MKLDGFNAEEIEPASSFDPIPAGWYSVYITDSEEKENSKGTGTYLQFTIEVIEGPHKGRMLWERLNLNHPNEVAVEIAQRTLSSICRAVNNLHPQDSAELHFKPMMAKVVQKKRKDTGELTNEIKGFKPAGETGAPAPTSSSGGASSGGKPPWQRTG